MRDGCIRRVGGFAPGIEYCREELMASDFPAAFAALREILKKHSDGMVVQADTPTDFTLVTRALAAKGKPLWFGCVLLKKSAVTYHLYPLYFNPRLQAAVPPELLARKQGKTCFNFQRPEPDLFPKLDELTRLGREAFERNGLLKPGPVPPERFEAALRAAGENPEALARRRKVKGKQAAAKRAATIRKRTAKQVRHPAGRK
jgi:hypothetical protein